MSILKSRILQLLPKDVIIGLYRICKNVTITDNNKKVGMIISLLDKYDIDYNYIASGTNRTAIFTDSYIFKIALDKLGMQDNWTEMSLSHELQPYVLKVYECNGIISVYEYVTVMSKEEFIRNKERMRDILAIISDRYLIGDIGTITKNFMNWGYRNDGELVILDFAYVYRIQGEEMICDDPDRNGNRCTGFLEYDEDFYKLVCPKCGKKRLFTDIRFRIDKEYEEREIKKSMEMATLVTQPITEIDDEEEENTNESKYEIEEGDDYIMTYKKHNNDNEISQEESEKSYNDAVQSFRELMSKPKVEECKEEDTVDEVIEEEDITPESIDVEVIDEEETLSEDNKDIPETTIESISIIEEVDEDVSRKEVTGVIIDGDLIKTESIEVIKDDDSALIKHEQLEISLDDMFDEVEYEEVGTEEVIEEEDPVADLRNELLEDEYDSYYDENIKENQEIKYRNKK